MYSPRKLAQGTLPVMRRYGCGLARILLVLICIQPAVLRAQGGPGGAIAQVLGDDISIEGGASASIGAPNGGPVSIFNGSVVTVHTGKARLTFATGGDVDICGPAKITLLQSAGSITLALSIGRIHLRLPAGAAIRVFTPTIIATPIDISGAARDITLGLDLNNSLCVLATSGALRLEQQFTGEGLIVPQAGDFLIASGKLVPTAGVSGNCDCDGMHAKSAPPPNIPLMGVSSAAQLQMPDAAPAQPTPAAAKSTEPPAAEPNVQLRVLAKEDEIHPSPQPQKDVAPPPPPPTAMPIYKIVMPPLGFSATSPAAPDDPSLDAVLLVRTVHVEPEYEFTGHVEAPAVGSATPSVKSAGASKEKKSGGFWSGLKRIFGGG
jgi:hypothetical protein